MDSSEVFSKRRASEMMRLAGRLWPHQNSEDLFLKVLTYKHFCFFCPKAKQAKTATSPSTSHHISLFFSRAKLQILCLRFLFSPCQTDNGRAFVPITPPELLLLRLPLLNSKDNFPSPFYQLYLTQYISLSCIKHFSLTGFHASTWAKL